MTQTLVLKASRDKAVVHGHPWIFSGAVEREPHKAAPGTTVLVESASGKALGWAAYSPASQIRARVWTTETTRPIDHAFFKRRVAEALAWRQLQCTHAGLDFEQTSLRLLHGESDGLPGVICDAYRAQRDGRRDDWLVVQITSAGGERWRDAIVQALIEATGIEQAYERSDSDVRALEGMAARTGPLGASGAQPDPAAWLTENGVRMHLDIAGGHKTGFYLDQRDNRALVGAHAQGRRVLNCFCYTGGFSLAALRGGATEVVSIDSSADALAIAQSNVALNGLDAGRAQWWCDDVFQALRRLKAEGREFDLIVLDPPKLAPSAAHAERAARAYKDINLLGFRLLAPGGLLFTYSCSGAISSEFFQKIVAGAAADAPADAFIERRLAAGFDHPLKLGFPEGEYLKGLMLRKR